MNERIEQAAIDHYAISYSPFDDPYENSLQFELECECFKAGAEWALSHQWISVDEELPEENELVIFRNEEDVAVGVYIGGKWFLTWTNGREFPREVTHWMHIPTLEGGEE